jgi:hypothetical protein
MLLILLRLQFRECECDLTHDQFVKLLVFLNTQFIKNPVEYQGLLLSKTLEYIKKGSIVAGDVAIGAL